MGESALHSYVSGELTHDTNAAREPTGVADSYQKYTAGLNVSRQSDTLSLNAGAWISDQFYMESDRKESSQWGVRGSGRVRSDKSFVSGSMDFRKISDSAGSEDSERGDDQIFDRVDNDRYSRFYTSSLAAGQRVSETLSVQFSYVFKAVEYELDSLQGWNTQELGSEASVRLTDKTSAFVNAAYGWQTGEGAQRDARSVTARTGIAYAVTEKTSLRLGAGATHYFSSTENYTEGSFELSGNWKVRDGVLVFVTGSNAIEPTGDGGEVALASRAGAGVRLQLTDISSIAVSGGFLMDRGLGDSAADLDSRRQFARVWLGYSPGRFGVSASAEAISANEASSAYGGVLQERIGTVTARYALSKRLDVYTRAEYSETEATAADSYSRFRGTVGAEYSF